MSIGKAYLNRLPTPEPTPRPTGNNKLALIYPIFQGTQAYFNTRFIRSAAWSAQSILANSDFQDIGGEVFFFVERCVWEKYSQLFQDSMIPIDNIVLFYSPKSDFIQCNRVSKKFYILTIPRFDAYEQLLVWDCDLFLGRSDPKGDRFSFADSLIPSGITLLDWDPGKAVEWQSKHYWWHKFNDLNNHEEYLRLVPKMYDVVGFNPIPDHILDNGCWREDPMNLRFPKISGGVHHYIRHDVSDDFIKFCQSADPLIGDDENILHLWYRKTGIGYESMQEEWGKLSCPTCFDVKSFKSAAHRDFYNDHEHLKDQEQANYYFTHIYMEQGDGTGWEKEWHKQLGVV